MTPKEIEVKLTYRNKRKIIGILKRLGAKSEGRYALEDSYFSRHGSMSNQNEILRIRKKGEDSELTFKGKCIDKGNIWKRTELSTGISDSKTLEKIIVLLGLKKLKENISERDIYTLGGLEIVFIEFSKPQQLSILELEGMEKSILKLINKLEPHVQAVGEDAFSKFDRKTRFKRSDAIIHKI